jgi:hypothetical protein
MDGWMDGWVKPMGLEMGKGALATTTRDDTSARAFTRRR